MKKDALYAGSNIRTYSGTYLNVFNIDPDKILIEDIAHGLSLQCRFSGHTKEFYSVAEHSIWVANMVPHEQRLAALLHDASEAYLTDMPKPIKELMPEYKQIENSLMTAIAQKFGFEWPMSMELVDADKAALEFEWSRKVLANKFKSMSPLNAKRVFMDKFHKYVSSEKVDVNV